MVTARPAGTDPLTRVISARVHQIGLRLALAAIVGTVFQVVADWRMVLAVTALYVVHQAAEYCCLRGVSSEGSLSPGRRRAALASMFIGNAIFGALGVLGALEAGPWGLLCACLLWSGAILNAAMNSAGCRSAMVAWTCMPILYFLSAPFFVAYYGAKFEYGVIILISGALYALITSTVWSSFQKRVDAEEQARHAARVALHDAETDLPNRLAFEREIADRLERDRNVFVAVLGMDRYADLRAAIGYALSTDLIQQVAIRLRDVNDGPIARLSTSRLGVILSAEDMAEARFYAARLQSVMANPLRVDGNEVDVSLTIGLAGGTDEGDASALLEHASIALDQASKARSGIGVFDGAHYKSPTANLSLMSEMLRSIEKGEITNFYQPKYDLRSGKVIGVEALVRWRHPERGMIPPDTFISMAEETGRIRELTIDVLSRAVRDQAKLAERGYMLSFAVNLSGRLLHDDEIAGTLLDIISPATGKIILEVTETSMMENPEKALRILHQFRDVGIDLSIDDYGSGLSSLAYLKNIPAHELKIDKAFVMHMDESQRDALLVRSTVALAHSLGLKVTAEGVESATALTLLRSMNCDCAQGYHMSRPIPFDDLAALLDAGSAIEIGNLRQNASPTADGLGVTPAAGILAKFPWV